MSLLSRLFGRRPAAGEAKREAVDYKGFRITPAPVREAGGWRIAAQVEKEVDGETRHHHLVRADTLGDAETAAAESVGKAKMVIDQIGDRIFD